MHEHKADQVELLCRHGVGLLNPPSCISVSVLRRRVQNKHHSVQGGEEELDDNEGVSHREIHLVKELYH